MNEYTVVGPKNLKPLFLRSFDMALDVSVSPAPYTFSFLDGSICENTDPASQLFNQGFAMFSIVDGSLDLSSVSYDGWII